MRTWLPLIDRDGLLRRRYPGPWIAPTWTRDPATGLWSSTGIVPDADVIVNGNFAAWTGDNPDWWTLWGTETGSSYVTEAPAGKCKIVSDGGNMGIYKDPILTVGRWYKIGCDLDTVVSGGLRINTGYLNKDFSSPGEIYITAPAITGGRSVYFVRVLSGCNVTIDNAYAKLLILSQLIAYRDYGRQANIASALTMNAGIGGVVSRLSVNSDGTFNYVDCWHDGVNLHLDTVVNSYTRVSKVNAAAAYGATKAPAIKYAGPNTAQAFYGTLGSEVQVGADQDVSAVPSGTFAGLFSTDPSVTLSDPVVT